MEYNSLRRAPKRIPPEFYRHASRLTQGQAADSYGVFTAGLPAQAQGQEAKHISVFFRESIDLIYFFV